MTEIQQFILEDRRYTVGKDTISAVHTIMSSRLGKLGTIDEMG